MTGEVQQMDAATEADVAAPGVRPHWPGGMVSAGPYDLHVRRCPATSDAAEPGLFVHGLGGASTNWTDLMGLLADRVDGSAVDLPGFGYSAPPPDRDYSPAGHMRALVALLESRGDAPVHLFGNSLGGAVVVRLAALRPDLVRTLTLVSPALPVLRPRRTNVHMPALALPFVGQQLMKRVGHVPVEARVRATIALSYADPSRVPPERYAQAVAEVRRRAALEHDAESVLLSLRGLIGTYLRRGQATPWQLAGRISAPTLLVYGLRDKLVDPRSAHRAARTIPGARLVVLPDTGHVAQMERPEVVAAAVRELLAAGPAGWATPAARAARAR